MFGLNLILKIEGDGKMDVDANVVIDKLCNQLGQMAKALAVRDAQIELLQKEIAKLSEKE